MFVGYQCRVLHSQNVHFRFVGLVIVKDMPPLLSLHCAEGSASAYLTYVSYLPSLYYILTNELNEVESNMIPLT